MNSFTTTPVRFDRDTVELVGNLYVPDGPGPHPAVVVTGTWTSVKEQMANRHAEHMAARGYVALSFDSTNFGDSGGGIRDFESPALKIRDIHNAVTYLAARPEVDTPDRIAASACAPAPATPASTPSGTAASAHSLSLRPGSTTPTSSRTSTTARLVSPTG
jgi:uncharacterized protein